MIPKANKQAAAELRKGKKPVKDQLEALLKDAGELAAKEEGGGTPPPPPPGGGGDGSPTGSDSTT